MADTNNPPILDDEDEKDKQEKQSKDQKKFEAALRFVTSLVGGSKNLTPAKKVNGNDAASLVAKLFKDEKEKLREEFVSSLKELLKKYVEMEGEISKKQKELDELKKKKQKEFTQAVNSWKNKVEESDIMNQNYANALNIAFTKADEDEKK